MQMQPQPGGGGMMPNSYPQQGGGIIPQMGYNPQQMQQLSGFNQQQPNNHMKSGPSQQYPPNSSFMPMKPNNGVGNMCPQQGQQIFQNQNQNHQGIRNGGGGGGGMNNEINIDQMINNITEDPNPFSDGEAELFHSLDTNNYTSILDGL